MKIPPPPRKNAWGNVSFDEANRTMNFRLGSKTQLEKETITVGGNALNVAVGLARQGVEAELYSIIGTDKDGERIVDFLREENSKFEIRPAHQSLSLKANAGGNSKCFDKLSILSKAEGQIQNSNDQNSKRNNPLNPFRENPLEIRENPKANIKQTDGRMMLNYKHVQTLESIKTNVGYCVNFMSERFLLIDTSAKKYDLNLLTPLNLKSADWVFLSSIGPIYENFFNDFLKLKQEKDFRLAYNPSSNEFKNPINSFMNMVEAADILFVNKKEAMKILGEKEDTPLQKTLLKLWGRNQKVVVATDGVRGSYAYGGEGIFYCPASGEKAIEKTGAGDAFESGFLAEYLKTNDLLKSLKNGTENAGSVIKHVGPVAGLQYRN